MSEQRTLTLDKGYSSGKEAPKRQVNATSQRSQGALGSPPEPVNPEPGAEMDVLDSQCVTL